MANHILVVDDDPSICEALERGLRLEGFAVRIATNGEAAIQEIELTEPALLILDINMPQVDGIQVIKYIRSKSIDLPVCVLSARDEIQDRVLGLEAGADDYLRKPFDPKELSARVRALLRRSKTVGAPSNFTFDQLEIIADEGMVRIAGKEVHLTRTEFKLLVELASNNGKVLSREDLLERVWGYDYFGDSRLVDVHVRRLRTKVEIDPANPKYVVTVRGMGYKLQTQF